MVRFKQYFLKENGYGFFGDKSKEEHRLDWLERHNVQKEDGKYVFYHGSRLDLDYLRAGSLLETTLEKAAKWGNQNFLNSKRKIMRIYKVLVEPKDIHCGFWASLENDHPIDKKLVVKIKNKDIKD